MLLFMERVMEEMPFPIQRIQTDRGTKFFAIKVQEYFMEQSIKFRPIKPGSPHLIGKVERSQQAGLYEFYTNFTLIIYRMFLLQSSVYVLFLVLIVGEKYF